MNRFSRLPTKDPRTVARDIPGISKILFPRLIPGIVAHLNSQTEAIPGCVTVNHRLLSLSKMPRAMLFEIGQARAEQIIRNEEDNWDKCVDTALSRQSRFFDAQLPIEVTDVDIEVADQVAWNTYAALQYFRDAQGVENIKTSPPIPGYQWIASSFGDYSINKTLIEVKCSARNFGASDYRQILMYWLLSCAGAVEKQSSEWRTGILLNPRLNQYLEFSFNELFQLVGPDRSKSELLEIFCSLIGDNSMKMHEESERYQKF